VARVEVFQARQASATGPASEAKAKGK
jgi:hypothetical protein